MLFSDGRRVGPLPKRTVATCVLLLMAALGVQGLTSASSEIVVFGPETYQRQPGAPTTVSKQFTMASANGEYVLRVANNGITSATVVLNGSNVLQPNDFTGKQTTSLEKPVTLRAGTNTLSVQLRSQGSLSISIVDLRGDVTPPTITAVPSPLANAAGWNNGPVTVTFTCSDADSTVASCPAPVNVSTEGSAQIVTGTAVDSAGNSASVSLTLNIDLTPPVVTAAPAPEANADGWNNAPVTVTFSASDGLSGLAPGTLTAPVTLSSEGSGLTATGQATDLAGNTGSVTRTGINIDATKPVVTATPSAPPNANGWNNTDVTVTFACSDEGSLVASCPLSVTVTAEGASQTVSGTAIDKAGNTANASVTLSIDKTPPVVTSTQSPDPNAAGWNNGQVIVTFSASDGLSGVAPGSTTAPVTLSTDGTNLSATGQAADLAGNVGSHTRSGISIDTGAPVITPSVSVPPNANGWNNTDVTLTFTCSDAAIAVCPEPVTVTTEGAGQIVARTALDKAGNAAEASVTLSIDKTPPVLSGTQSPDPNAAGWNNDQVTVTFTATDALSGVAPGTLTAPIVLISDGANLSASGEAIDLAGNVGRLTRTRINIDMTAPLIAATRTPAANGNGWNNTAVTVHFDCSDGLSGIVSCPPDQPVSTEGSGQPVAGSVSDVAGNTATTSTTVNIDTTPPAVSLSPPPIGDTGATVYTPSVNVSGTTSDGGSGIDSVTCNGVGATVSGGAVTCLVSLTAGANIVEALARDRAGNTNTASLTYNYNPVPIITIASPANLFYTNISPTTITGTVDDSTATVVINTIPAPVANGQFTIALPLAEGPNLITATATTAAGASGTATLTVTLDTTPPRVTITSPPDQFVTTDGAISITGNINDIVVGTVNPEQAGVTVNGGAAQVANRTFLRADVPLALGPNVIQAVARDRVGNQSTTEITVTRQAPAAQPRIRLVSGNNQSAVIGTGLSEPLVVALTDAAGAPAAGKPVIFKVTQNDGFVRTNGGTQAMSGIATTDAQGQAVVEWTVGKRAGAGGNTVEAYSVGFEGTAIFTATGNQGAAGKIVVDTGNNQIGSTGQRLPKPFIAVVVDEGNNRLAGVPVTFTVSEGGGDFDGQPSLAVTSDPDGRVAATLTLGTQEGNSNNLVSATFDSNQGFPAAFAASGRAPGDPTKTTITGVVLDNSNVPIPGVTVRAVERDVLHANGNAGNTVPAVQTDAQGQFTISQAPVGYVKLMVDGSTATLPGSYPNLEYDMVTVAGQPNTVQQPIFLLPLNTANSLCVTDTTGGGTLTIPEAPGFSLTFGPGQVTFPGGSKTGCVSVTVVNSDKVPMSPGFGQQPRFIVTIQPAGAMFNPPAPITLPNVDGLAPRAVTEMYSFDHDISSFVAIGTGTVSDDGLIIRSSVGVGVLKAGWHCGGNPQALGTTADCGFCRRCVSTSNNPTGECIDDTSLFTPCTRPCASAGRTAESRRDSLNVFDPTYTFATMQTCIAQTACLNSTSLTPHGRDWLDSVLPDFINKWANNTGSWSLVAAQCRADVVASAGIIPVYQSLCAYRMALYHITVDLFDSLQRFGPGADSDWLNLQGIIDGCVARGGFGGLFGPLLSGFAIERVEALRNGIRDAVRDDLAREAFTISDVSSRLDDLLSQCPKNNPDYDCQEFLNAGMKSAYGIHDFDRPDLNKAEKIGGYMAEHDDVWLAIGTADDAEALIRSAGYANDGYAVVAVGSGHVAFVIPGDLQPSTAWNTWVPNSASASLNDPEDSYVGKGLSEAWKNNERATVTIYRRYTPSLPRSTRIVQSK